MIAPPIFFTGYLSIPPVGTGLNVNTAALKKGGNYIFGFMSGMARGFTSTLFLSTHNLLSGGGGGGGGALNIIPFSPLPTPSCTPLLAGPVHCDSLYFLLKHNPSIKNRVMRPRQWGISGFSIREFFFIKEWTSLHTKRSYSNESSKWTNIFFIMAVYSFYPLLPKNNSGRPFGKILSAGVFII